LLPGAERYRSVLRVRLNQRPAAQRALGFENPPPEGDARNRPVRPETARGHRLAHLDLSAAAGALRSGPARSGSSGSPGTPAAPARHGRATPTPSGVAKPCFAERDWT